MMRRKALFATIIGLFVCFIAVLLFVLLRTDAAVLNPQGSVGAQERDLMMIATLLMLIVVIPVFFLTFFIAWKYRASNTKATYRPNWDHNHIMETIWWGVPLVIIGVLAVITWVSTHQLDPYKPLASDKEPVTIQVVAQQWKWLFLYPEQGVASVNFLQIPVDRPINFEITSDAPMNSFWIPQLGGQVYAMAGMQTKLHLIANEPGSYPGVSANISGERFADMKFTALATSQEEFDAWIEGLRRHGGHLSHELYTQLLQPGTVTETLHYATHDETLYDTILMKYMQPGLRERHALPVRPGVDGEQR